MKKNIVLFASLIASLFIAGSCQKYDVQESVDENATVSSLSVKATLATATGEGMKTTIAADDVLRVRFVDAGGKVVGRTQMLTNKSGEGASATFSADAIAIPNGAQDVIVFLDNRTTGKINYGSTPTKADFLTQDGTLKGAQGLQLIGGMAKVGNDVNVELTYATTIVKAEVSYPEGVEPKEGETTISLAVNEIGSAIIGNDVTGDRENITVNAKVDASKKTSSAYIAVLVKDLKDGTLLSNVGSTRYGCDLKADNIKAGTTLVAKAATEVLVYNFKFDSASQTIDNVAGTIAESDADWITLNNGKFIVAENTSGAYRKGTVVMSTMKTYKVEQSQFKAADFAGKYAFYSYSFNAFYVTEYGEIGKTVKVNHAGREHKTAVEFVVVENPQEINGHVHNLDLIGLYWDFKLPVSIEFTEDGPTVNMYLTKEFQTVTDGSKTQKIAAIPELTNSTSYSSGYFAPQKFGPDDCNYCWVGWGIDTENNRFTLGSGDQRKVSDNRWFCGFSFSLEGYAEGKYTTIYQLNYKNKWVFDITTGGAYFQKEVE